jgi:MmyB-like transcription regulator ligand binding domain
MQPLRESLRRLLDAHQPNPALIVDGLWNLIEANPAASLLWDGVDPALLEPPINMLRLAVHPDGLPRISSMTAACNTPLIHQLRRKSRDDADAALAELVDELESYLPSEPPAGPVHQPVVSLDLQTRLGEVSLFTLIATLGAPLEVTAANLAIETFLPAKRGKRGPPARASRFGGAGHRRAGLSAGARSVSHSTMPPLSELPPITRTDVCCIESQSPKRWSVPISRSSVTTGASSQRSRIPS